MDEGPSDAELEAIAKRIRNHRRKDMLARGAASLVSIICAVVFVLVFIEYTGWLIPAVIGFAAGAPVYMILVPKPLPDE